MWSTLNPEVQDRENIFLIISTSRGRRTATLSLSSVFSLSQESHEHAVEMGGFFSPERFFFAALCISGTNMKVAARRSGSHLRSRGESKHLVISTPTPQHTAHGRSTFIFQQRSPHLCVGEREREREREKEREGGREGERLTTRSK